MNWSSDVKNTLIFQCQWGLCLASAIFPALIGVDKLALMIVMLRLVMQRPSMMEMMVLMVLVFLGGVHDVLLLHWHVFDFPRHSGWVLPIWLWILWFCFGDWFLRMLWFRRHRLRTLLFFVLVAPLGYLLGAHWGALYWGSSWFWDALLMGISWLVLGFMYDALSNKLRA